MPYNCPKTKLPDVDRLFYFVEAGQGFDLVRIAQMALAIIVIIRSFGRKSRAFPCAWGWRERAGEGASIEQLS